MRYTPVHIFSLKRIGPGEDKMYSRIWIFTGAIMEYTIVVHNIMDIVYIIKSSHG